jgi:integrase
VKLMAEKVRLTRTLVESYELTSSGSARREYQDADVPYLILRVGAKTKTYYFQKKKPGQSGVERVVLGNHPEVTTEQARLKAVEALGSLIARKSVTNDPEHGPLMKDAWLTYEKKFIGVKLKASSQADYRRQWVKHIEPVFGEIRITEITRPQVRGVFELRTETTHAQANKFLTVIASFYKFALTVDEWGVEKNPTVGIEMNPTIRKKRRLERQHLGGLGRLLIDLPPLYRNVYLSLLLTGQRRTETVSMEWKEIDWSRKAWVIPGDEELGYKKGKTKNGKTHSVPLTKSMIVVLTDMKRYTGKQRFVFHCDGEAWNKTEATHVGAATITQFLAKRFAAKKMGSLPKFSPHDLRRTAFTGMTSLTGDLIATKRVVNHLIDTGASGHYDYHHYDPQKLVQLEAWEKEVLEHIPWLAQGAHFV